MAVLPVIIFAAVLSAFFLPGLFRQDPNDLPSTRIGAPAPALVAPDGQPGGFGDETLRSAGVKLVNFWASWCPPCRQEHPFLLQLAESGLPIYGINYKDTPDKAALFLEALGNPFTAQLIDPDGRNGIEWGVLAMPESYLIDRNGVIILHFRGPIDQSVIENRIKPAIIKAKTERP
ncbi:MAG: DsbE family thiol:disulfide interchange protein [Rhodobacterales bacterium]|nr:MAG: DsbE family thiol:disulfide interchange protein [Rhodobacterales bacterium]